MHALLLAAILAATVPDWQHDLDALVHDIEANHPDPFAKVGRQMFLQRVDILRADLPKLSDEQRMAGAMRIVASIRDGHTWLEPDRADFALWYPVRIYEFTDGYFITSAHKSVADLAGAQVVEIAGRPVHEVAEAARDLLSADNESGRKEALYALANAPLMRGLGYANADGALRIKCKLRNGTVTDRTLMPHKSDDTSHYKPDDSTFEWRFRSEVAGLPFGSFADWISAYKGLTYEALRTTDLSRPPHLTLRTLYAARAIPEHDAYYVQANQVAESLVPFMKKALAEVDQQKPRRLILDLRLNFGGDGSHVTEILHQFIKREDAKPWKELYILTGRKTFSAAVLLLGAFVENTELSLVGEPPGAGWNSFGDPTEIHYERTGMQLDVSVVRHELARTTDTRDIIAVDVPASFSFADWSEGRDPAVDAILRGDEMRRISVIASMDGAAPARAAFRDRAQRFANVRGWEPPPEIAMRRICQSLAAEKKFEQAIDVCTLGTEVHPEIWNTWYNLARAQRQAGMGQEGAKNLAQVLDIDPGNFNRMEIERLQRVGLPALKPDVIRYGATVADTEKALAGACKTMKTRRVDPPFLDNVKDRQMQIDCDGFVFQGKPRWTEFVFRDDSLEMVWIMATKEEQQPIVDSMKAAYGEPSSQNAHYIAFARYGTAWRVDKAEVLFLAPDLAGEWREEFAK